MSDMIEEVRDEESEKTSFSVTSFSSPEIRYRIKVIAIMTASCFYPGLYLNRIACKHIHLLCCVNESLEVYQGK
jgi:hypothetical protein